MAKFFHRIRSLQWLKEGDKKTKFFHQMANVHKMANQIRKITVEGIQMEDEYAIKNGIVRFHQRLHSDNGDWKPNLECLSDC